MIGFIKGFWTFLFYCSCLSIIYYTFPTVVGFIKGRPATKIRFVEKAVKDNSHTIGKVSCYLLKGRRNKYLEIEYAYEVDGKVYFLTYRNRPYNEYGEDSASERLADTVNMECRVYYNKKHPAQAIVKREIFVSDKHFKRIRTVKNNKFRNIAKDWTEPLKTHIF